MNLKTIIGLTVVGLILILGGGLFLANISYNNEATNRYTDCAAQEQNVAITHTNMWQILKDQAKIPSKYAADFDKIYTDLIGGRYSKGDGTLMKWIQERNPQFSSTMYENLMKSVEIQRTAFANEQKSMVRMSAEYNKFLKRRPASWFISAENNKPYIYKEILCGESVEVMKTRVDNNELTL